MPLAISPCEDKVAHRGPSAISPSEDKLPGAVHHHDKIIIRKVKRGNRKPMRFGSLHHHSTFSYLDGYKIPEEHVRRAVELQMPNLAMTEHGNIDSHVKFEKAALAEGIKPIFGCEIYMPCPWDDRGQRKMHLTVLAYSPEGYQNLLRIVTDSYKRKPGTDDPVEWNENGFRYEPTVTFDRLVEHKAGLIVMSGCAGSLLFCSLVGGKGLDPNDASYKRGLRVAREFRRHFGANYYIEVQAFPELERTRAANPLLARVARCIGARLVATMDCHYTAMEEAEVQKILHSLRPGEKRTLEQLEQSWGYDIGLCPPVNDNSILRKLALTGLTREQCIEAIQSTADIAEGCNVTLPRLPMVRFPLPSGWRSAEEYMRAEINKGWKFRGFDKLPKPEQARYKRRIRREFGLIAKKDYCDYFLILSDAISHIKDLGIPVGPARGSAAASLVAYCLRIIEINPMVFPLLVFERFMDETRDDLPDIDIDFPSEVRDHGIMREFLQAKYPSVVNVGTFNKFKGKNSLDDVARVFGVPKFEVDKIKNNLIERSSGDLRASATIEDTYDAFPEAADVVERFPDLRKSALLEGNVKSTGSHAAGYVVSQGDISEITAVYRRKIHEVFVDVVSLDKKDAERQGLVKMDFLGLATMSALWQMIKWLGMTADDLYGLPLDDPAVYDGFKNNDVVGIFQYDGKAQRNVCQMLKPDKFSEVMDGNALSRPGPLHNGAATAYADIKFGRRRADRFHPAVDAITSPTQFQIVYQEQVLRIVREIGDFPWTNAAHIRRIIAQKLGEQEFARQWDRFWEGCQTLHKRTEYPPISLAQAKQLFGYMITSGSYSFNAAHCAAYAVLAVWTMWFKQHHPDVFYAASMKYYGDDKTLQLMRDAERPREGAPRLPVMIMPPSFRNSEENWKPYSRGSRLRVLAGFSGVKGIGDKMAPMIVAGKPYNSWDDLQKVRGIGPKKIARIKEFVGAEDPFEVFTLENAIKKAKAELETREIIDPHTGNPLPVPNMTSVEQADAAVGRGVKVVWIGTVNHRNTRDFFEVNQARGSEVDAKSVRDPHLREFCLLRCEDEDDVLHIKIDRWKWPIYKEAILKFELGHDLLLVEGFRPKGAYSMKIKRLWVLDPDDADDLEEEDVEVEAESYQVA